MIGCLTCANLMILFSKIGAGPYEMLMMTLICTHDWPLRYYGYVLFFALLSPIEAFCMVCRSCWTVHVCVSFSDTTFIIFF